MALEGFKPKEWVNGSGGGTPISAAALIDLETRLNKAGAPLVTAFPAAPSVGDEVNLVVDEANGIVWTYVYTGIGALPWRFKGGVPLRAFIGTQQTTTSTAYTDLATVGPQLTAPIKGLYQITCGAVLWNSEAGKEAYIGESVAVAAPPEEGYVRANTNLPMTLNNNSEQEAAKGANIRARYKVGGGGGTLNAALRWIEIIAKKASN